MDKWVPRLVTGSVILVLIFTLFPFDFSVNDGFSIQTIVNSFHHSSNLNDWLNNILLFLPFGFGLTCLMQRTKLGSLGVIVTVLIASAGLSLTVEVLQVFLPARSPTVADIWANSLGGLLGFVCFVVGRVKFICYTSAFIIRIEECLSIKTITLAFLGYFALTLLISLSLQNATNLSNWDQTFPLVLGNESTGYRPWQGYISQLYIADRAMSEAEVERAFSDQQSWTAIGDSLVGFYPLTGRGSYRDQTGNLPALSWQGQPPDVHNGTGVFLSANHWLKTATPPSLITQKLRQTSQFTLSVTIATADTKQSGPARIVSLSADPFHRNFTLGQQGMNLVLRLRTPITGKNGLYPELILPKVFCNTNPHHLLISYNGSLLQLYIAQRDQSLNYYSFELNPEITIFRYLLFPLTNWTINIATANPLVYRLLYYGLMFIPLGFSLGLITRFLRGFWLFDLFIIAVVILLPTWFLECILAQGSGRDMKVENLLISIGITLGTMLLVKIRFLAGFKRYIKRHIGLLNEL
ncbi:MAG: VanZ family protein [Moorea sp. SIO2I5]|nr:VanZ family protein [Moorena sp. SIO2I5]